VSKGEAVHLGWVMAHLARAMRRVRAARGFYIAQSGRCPDLLVIGGLTAGVNGEVVQAAILVTAMALVSGYHHH